MLSSYNVGIHDTGGGVQGVDGGIDTQLSDGTGQHSGGVQVGEGGGRGGVSQIISGHIDGLPENKSSLGLGMQTINQFTINCRIMGLSIQLTVNICFNLISA